MEMIPEPLLIALGALMLLIGDTIGIALYFKKVTKLLHLISVSQRDILDYLQTQMERDFVKHMSMDVRSMMLLETTCEKIRTAHGPGRNAVAFDETYQFGKAVGIKDGSARVLTVEALRAATVMAGIPREDARAIVFKALDRAWNEAAGKLN